MLRLFKLTRYSRALRALLDVLRKESDTLVAAMLVLFIMLIISASGIYLLEHKLQPEAFSNIPDAMWWAIATLTTVGYGDIVPITPLGKLFGGIIGLIGVGMVALPAAILASGFAENLQKRRQRFSSQVKHMLADGEIDEEERWQLERLRRELRLDSEEAIQLLDTFMRRPKSFPVESCPHCGKKLERRKKPRETAL
jgi:voltage-gated potassium channel